MRVIVVLSNDFVSYFSKPMKVSKVKAFKNKYNYFPVIYFERKYNLLEKLCMFIKNKAVK